MASRFSPIDNYERVEIDMRVLDSHELIQDYICIAARVRSISSDDIIHLLMETFLFL